MMLKIEHVSKKFKNKEVILNYEILTNPSYLLKEEDIFREIFLKKSNKDLLRAVIEASLNKRCRKIRQYNIEREEYMEENKNAEGNVKENNVQTSISQEENKDVAINSQNTQEPIAVNQPALTPTVELQPIAATQNEQVETQQSGVLPNC